MYIILAAVASAVFPALLLWADVTGGARRTWAAGAVLAFILATAGFLDWYLPYRTTGYTETSGALPITVALIPTLVATATIRATARTRWSPALRWLLAALACAAAAWPSAILGHYFIPQLLPGRLGCCPL